MHPRFLEPLARWEKYCLLALVLISAFFSDLVLYRSALVERIMGDGPIFLRAAWAVRTGGDPYQLTDHNGWHYNYPPIFAISLTPLADPPPGISRAGYLPIALSISLFYKINLLVLGLTIHALCRSLENLRPDLYPQWSRAWWYLRIFPFLCCIVTIGHTLMRAQSNLIVLMWLSFYLCGILNNRNFWGGFSLSAAVCIKIFPALVIIQPLARLQWRTIIGGTIGLILFLIMIPVLVMGPQPTLRSYQSLGQAVLGPALGLAQDESRATELIQITATDNQSLQAVIHNLRHPYLETKPNQIDGLTRLLSMGIGVFLLGILVVLILRKGEGDWERVRQVLLGQGLICLMLLMSPVGHSHYGVLLLPGMTVLLWLSWVAPDQVSCGRVVTLMGVVLASQIIAAGQIPSPIPGTGILRHFGFGIVGMMGLLGECVRLGANRKSPFFRDPEISKSGEYPLAA